MSTVSQVLPQSIAAPVRLARGIASLVRRFVAWRSRRAAMEALAMMSDRELADMGITRSDLALGPTVGLGGRWE